MSVSRRRVGDTVEIAVTDRGIGIAPQHQTRVFERFFRVDPARSRATGGTGLGLAIVKHVLANHGGHVRLWSSPGTGSTFTMCLPARAADRAAAACRHHHRSRRTCMTRVLIVEDEESFAEPLEFLLRKEGFTTAVAATGQGALEEFDRNGADIVLLDLMLPGMSGTDVCKALRTRSAVPVIMVTARDSEIDKVVGLELGADDYVTKPYSARELIARIRAVLRRGGEAADGEPAPGVLSAGPVRMDVERHVVSVDGDGGGAAAQGVRPAGVPAAQRRARAHPGPADRPGVGGGLRRRHQDARRARQATAVEGGGRPVGAAAPGHRSAGWGTSSRRDGLVLE